MLPTIHANIKSRSVMIAIVVDFTAERSNILRLAQRIIYISVTHYIHSTTPFTYQLKYLDHVRQFSPITFNFERFVEIHTYIAIPYNVTLLLIKNTASVKRNSIDSFTVCDFEVLYYHWFHNLKSDNSGRVVICFQFKYFVFANNKLQ